MKTDRFATRKEDVEIADKRKKVMVYNNPTPQPLFIEEKGKQKKLGELNKGDLVFILTEDEDKGLVNFHVLKLADSENQWLVFIANKNSFIPHEVKTETFANVNGNTPNVDKEGKLPSEKKIKNNYSIPIVAGLGGGVIGFLTGKRAGQNPYIWGVIGVAVFAGLGYIATQIDKTENDKIDLSGSTIMIPSAK